MSFQGFFLFDSVNHLKKPRKLRFALLRIKNNIYSHNFLNIQRVSKTITVDRYKIKQAIHIVIIVCVC